MNEAAQTKRQFLLERLARLIPREFSRSGYENTMLFLVCLNLVMTFARPQDFPGLGFIGAARIPMFVSIICMLGWLGSVSNTWCKQTKVITFFFICEGFRGFIGVFADPSNTFVVNDFWHFHIWKDLGLQYFGLCFPIISAMSYVAPLVRVSTILSWIGMYLGFWAISHGGKGPGGFLGDENDMCLVLVMLLPFAGMLVPAVKGLLKLISIGAVVAILGGIVATSSRGGFLGLVVVLAFFFVGAKNKIAMISAVVIGGLLLLPLVPDQYWKEVKSIQTDAQSDEGTMKERFDTWKVAWRMFCDPKNMFFGVGLNNTPYSFRDYEPAGTGTIKKSLAGRAMHSLYFQLLPDLGLWGVAIVGTVVGSSLLGLLSLGKRIRRRLKLMQNFFAEQDNLKQKDKNYDPNLAHALNPLRRISRELDRLDSLRRVLIGSWLGTLVAGIGIAVLYYPPIWMLACMSAAAFRVANRMENICDTALEAFAPEASNQLAES